MGFFIIIRFHVGGNMSSAHVYLRLLPGMTIDTIPPDVLEDCFQLVKANSRDGRKTDRVTIDYTAVSNLRKAKSMDVGQVGFVDDRQVRYGQVPAKINAIINRLNKTRTERSVLEMKAEREHRDEELRDRRKLELQAQARAIEEEKRRRKAEEDLRCYKSVMKPEVMQSNTTQTSSAAEYEEDFM
ncbi:coil domain protein [Pelomyxa schiedti]|nr:coil domain protein [Pelomyxa schiedti]